MTCEFNSIILFPISFGNFSVPSLVGISDSKMEEDLEDREGKSNIQKELIYNKLLPYSSGLDEESRAFLSEIKKNLSKAVLVRELRPGAVTWTGR